MDSQAKIGISLSDQDQVSIFPPADKVAQKLQKYKIILLRGYDSFAIGQTLDEAFHWSSSLEILPAHFGSQIEQ